MPYKAIIFDLDNTLLNFEICEYQAIIGGLKGGEISLDSYGVAEPRFLEIFEFYNSQYWKLRELFTPNQLIEKSYQDTLTRFNIRPASISQLSQAYWYIFNHSKIMEPGAGEMLNILVRSYRLGVITNGLTSTQLSRMRAAAIDRYFEVIVISEAIGFAKPSRQIFDYTLSRFDLKTTEVLYIGDSLKYDFEGAKQADVDFCYYNRKKESLFEQVQPKFVVEELSDLLEIL
ncbi:MAG: hypothetical protein RLZZ69_3320 [Cyanobacteriota bacterium]